MFPRGNGNFDFITGGVELVYLHLCQRGGSHKGEDVVQAGLEWDFGLKHLPFLIFWLDDAEVFKETDGLVVVVGSATCFQSGCAREVGICRYIGAEAIGIA